MDFIENINEYTDVRYEEIGEFEDPVLMINTIDDNVNQRFYPEDLKKVVDVLKDINKYPSQDRIININESYSLEYFGLRDDNGAVLVMVDMDNNKRYNFYEDDTAKLIAFLNRLMTFGIIKN